jgi:hypothetical protein
VPQVCETWEDPAEWVALISAVADPAAAPTPRKARAKGDTAISTESDRNGSRINT